MSTKEENTPPENFAYTEMTPCKSFKIGRVFIYSLEILFSVFLMYISAAIMQDTVRVGVSSSAFIMSIGAILVGIALMIFALRQLFKPNSWQAPCPHCRALLKPLNRKSKPFNCTSCGHRLGVYGLKLADMTGNDSNPVSSAPAGLYSVPGMPGAWYVPSPGVSFISLLIVAGYIFWLYGGGFDRQVANDIQKLHNDVAADFDAQYNIAYRNGNQIDKCVQAGITAAAYLQAKDEKKYGLWKNIQRVDCKAAGVPLH